MNPKLLLTVVTLVSLAGLVEGLKVFVAYKRSINALQAMQVCRQQGGYLASIESAAEHDKVLAAITATGYSMDYPNYWLIGGTNAGNQGVWIWLGTNKEITYKNFRAGQPDNNNNQDCLMITNVNGAKQWDDVGCDAAGYGFVCAYEMQ